MLLAAMLAMVLAAAAPVFAQVESEVEGDDNTTSTAQYVDCTQVLAAANVQYGDATADAEDDSEAVAEIAADQGISQNAVLACFGDVNDVNQGGDDAGDVSVNVEGSASAASDDGSASAASEGSASAASSSSASAAAELPETGGASLLALGAGALLVAGGLLARRIVR